MSLADIITARKQEALGEQLRASGFWEAASIIDKLVDFARDEIYLLDDVARAGRRVVESDRKIHKVYGSTAACNDAPGIVAGAAMTPHCDIACKNPKHRESVVSHRELISELDNALQKL